MSVIYMSTTGKGTQKAGQMSTAQRPTIERDPWLNLAVGEGCEEPAREINAYLNSQNFARADGDGYSLYTQRDYGVQFKLHYMARRMRYAERIA